MMPFLDEAVQIPLISLVNSIETWGNSWYHYRGHFPVVFLLLSFLRAGAWGRGLLAGSVQIANLAVVIG